MFFQIVCGVDFSESSRTALRHAGLIAARFGARLSVLAVNELLLAQAAAITYDINYLQEETEKALRAFMAQALTDPAEGGNAIVTTGPPAESILRVAAERHVDLIVLGTHGLSGYKKLFFGSVTESVLRRTPVPVLVTPALEPAGSEGYLCEGGVVLAPVDFSDHCATDVAAAAEFAQRTDASLLLLHVVPHPQGPALLQRYLEDQHRLIHAEAVARMAHLAAHLDTAVPVERLVRVGHPADEIVCVANEKKVRHIVMGLGGTPVSPRPGSIAYRVLCSGAGPILALPPNAAA